MKLNVLITDAAAQQFDCHGCTNCCRELVVHLTSADREAIDRQGWREKLGIEPYVLLRRETVLNHKSDGGCVFLQSDGRCRIHAEHGAQAKPLACRMYPFSIESQGGAIRASIRFDCPSVGRSVGQPIGRHRAEVNQLAMELNEAQPLLISGAGDRWFIRDGRASSEAEVSALIGVLDGWLADRNVSLDRRLAGMCRLVTTLNRAKLDAVRDERFVELLGLLRDGLLADDTNTEFDGDTKARAGENPTARQTRLFRQAVFAHCEHLSLQQARANGWSSLRFRLDQLRRARRFVRATGPCNTSLGGVSRADQFVSHEQVAAIRPAMGADATAAESLATRYMRQRLLARAAFGNAYYGWAVLDGVSSLLLSVAAVGWLGRYFAATASRNNCSTEDFVRAIAVVDRAAGRAPELGSRSARLRLTYLSADDGVLRLLRAWAWVMTDHP